MCAIVYFGLFVAKSLGENAQRGGTLFDCVPPFLKRKFFLVVASVNHFLRAVIASVNHFLRAVIASVAKQSPALSE